MDIEFVDGYAHATVGKCEISFDERDVEYNAFLSTSKLDAAIEKYKQEYGVDHVYVRLVRSEYKQTGDIRTLLLLTDGPDTTEGIVIAPRKLDQKNSESTNSSQRDSAAT